MKAEFMRLIVSNNTYKKLKDDIFDICDYIKLDEFQLRDIKRYVCAEYSVIHMENCVSIIYYDIAGNILEDVGRNVPEIY